MNQYQKLKRRIGTVWYFSLQKFIELVSRRQVMSGPFRGMQYPDKTVGNALYAKFLGMYEKELHIVWENLKERNFTHIIDVGAAEGYYVIGLARLFPNTQVTAFEIGSSEQAFIKEMAICNHVVERVKINGYCSQESLSKTLTQSDNTILIMDVEGTEVELLDPDLIPELRNVTIILETHDFLIPNCSDIIQKRFDASHQIQVIHANYRTRVDLPFQVPRLLVRWFLHVGSDQRIDMTQKWLLMTPVI